MKILVVEDDPNLGSLWDQVLQSAGHEVRLVDNETAALKILQTRSHDLVVLDLCMHGRQSLAVAMMATYRNPRCRVIVVGGSADFSQRVLFAMSPAVAAVLRKPVDIEDLMEVCEAVARNERPVPAPLVESGVVEFRP